MNTSVGGLSVRSLKVTIPIGLDAVGNLIGKTFSAAFPAEGFSREAGMVER
jgi:hypothetical protein